jgi:hypothetical protein
MIRSSLNVQKIQTLQQIYQQMPAPSQLLFYVQVENMTNYMPKYAYWFKFLTCENYLYIEGEKKYM